MKKKIFVGIAVLAIAAIAMFNVNLNTNQKSGMTLLTLANIEALASEGVNQCDITKYTRNAKEGWVTKEFEGSTDVNGYVIIKKVKFGPFGAGVTVKFNYQAGDCTQSSGNCCLKTHIDKVKLL